MAASRHSGMTARTVGRQIEFREAIHRAAGSNGLLRFYQDDRSLGRPPFRPSAECACRPWILSPRRRKSGTAPRIAGARTTRPIAPAPRATRSVVPSTRPNSTACRARPKTIRLTARGGCFSAQKSGDSLKRSPDRSRVSVFSLSAPADPAGSGSARLCWSFPCRFRCEMVCECPRLPRGLSLSTRP